MREVNMESIRSVDRAIDILNSFTLEQPSQTIEQIRTTTKLPRATVYRLLCTLERRGLVRYDAEKLQYRLGYAFLHYSNLLMSAMDIVNEAADILTELHVKTKQTVQMCMIESTQILYVFKREIQTGLKFSSQIGERKSLLYGALGRVALAYQPEEIVNRLLAGSIPVYTPNTVADPVKIRAELEEIRSTRLYVDAEGTTLGVTAIASPVFQMDGKLAAVIGMICPTVQITPEQLAEYKGMMLEAASKISANLGYAG